MAKKTKRTSDLGDLVKGGALVATGVTSFRWGFGTGAMVGIGLGFGIGLLVGHTMAPLPPLLPQT